MGMEKVEILLIELAGASIKNKLSWRHSISRTAPIGLYSLKATVPERIGLIDVPVTQISDMLAVYSDSPLKAVIFRLSENPDTDKVKEVFASVRIAFSQAKIGCNNINSHITKDFDFVINGTGKTSVLRILRGDLLAGYCDDLKNDLASLVVQPTELLVDVGYDVLPEKWLSVHNIEVFQPWLGLAEFSTALFVYPGLEYMIGFLKWLKDSGFDSVHFTPNKWTAEEINRLRAIVLKYQITLSISFLSSDSIAFPEILTPVKRIWIYNPQPSEMNVVIQKLKTIREAGFESCLQVENGWFDGGVTLPVCRYIDHLIINDDYRWNNADFKKLTQRFWGTKTRFFRRLFGLRTAAELIVFMKSSYALIDTLFLSDNKLMGDKQ